MKFYLPGGFLALAAIVNDIPRVVAQEDADQGSGTFDVDATGGTSAASDPDDIIQFKHFSASNSTQTCVGDEHALPFNNQIRGVNLGGWLVLEPWITPSLFYQFLDGDEQSVGMDMYSFCEVLGPEEGNKQLRRHWDTWVTEDIIKELAASGAVNSLRLPVGDWQYEPYGPYIGCTDGANDYVDFVLDWAAAYGLSVLIDVHGMKGSQNGFDNSGQSMGMQWTSSINVYPRGLTTFQHWPIRNAAWMGKFDVHTLKYPEINRANIQHSLDVLEAIAMRYSGHPAVLGLQPVNEPWEHTPIKELKNFYWQGYLIMKKHAPYWKYIMHDSFRFDTKIWGGFMKGCPDRALDTHIYQAWQDPGSRLAFFNDACAQKGRIADMESQFGPVVVGEWSLATDNCVMWLNGFNDNIPGFPRLPCKYVECADPYMGFDQPGTPVDPSKALQGPYGTGMSGPVWGLCPVGRDWVKERKKAPNDWMHAPPTAPKHLDDSDFVMSQLALKKIDAFSTVGHGFYFWNFNAELDDPHWSYLQALERGWIPKGNLNSDIISNACKKEDSGQFTCVCKRNQLESSVKGALRYCLNDQGIKGDAAKYVDGLEGDALYEEADRVFNIFWSKHRVEGATCDFGGLAMLKEINATDSDEIDDDFYYYYGVEEPSIANVIFKIFLGVVGGVLVGGLVGFFVAMRVSKKFNARVSRALSRSVVGRNLRSSKVFNATFHPQDYDEIADAEPSAWAQLTPSNGNPKA